MKHKRHSTLLLIVLGHLALVPMAIVLTLGAFGDQNALTLENQVTWIPAFAAQRVLLAIVIGLGTGAFSKRLGICLIAILATTVGTNLARASLATFDQSFFESMFLCCLRDVPYALPSVGVAIFLLFMRRLIGVLGTKAIRRNEAQLAIKDLLALLTVVAAMAAVCRWVIVDPRIPNPNFAALSLGTSVSLAGAVGAVLLTLSARLRWFGLLMLTAAIATSIAALSPLWYGIVSQAYLWGLVLLTLVALRSLGFRLHSVSALNRKLTVKQQQQERTTTLTRKLSHIGMV